MLHNHALRRGRPWAFAALLLSVPHWSLCATYTVDGVRGSDDNDGIAAPFKTIARGAAALQTSDRLVIVKMHEPYRESLPVRVGGGPRQPLIIDGGGATLSGADPAPQQGWQRSGDVYHIAQPQPVRFLFGPDTCYARGKAPNNLEPRQWYWQDGLLHLRPEQGKSPADYDLLMSVRISGVLFTGAGQVIVRNLTCERFYNDGFNIHGGSAPVWFEDIQAHWNGDEGFSCHENCECYVRTASFSHNQWHGVADVGFARSHYAGIDVRDNVHKGIFFIGGMHSVIDSYVGGSPVNVALARGDIGDFPHLDSHPMRRGRTNLRNVAVRSSPGQTGVQVMPQAEGVFEHCLIEGGLVGLRVDTEGLAHVSNSIIQGARQAEVIAQGAYAADHNIYHPGRFVIAGQAYAPDRFEAYRMASGNDEHSFLDRATFIGDTLWASRASIARGAAFGKYSYGGADIGPMPRGARPEEPASILPHGVRLTQGGRLLYTYDFEQTNPWSRVYPVPATSRADAPVESSAQLSAEQAHSGKRSMKLSVGFPTPPPNAWMIKLFSDRMHYESSVQAVRFWLLGDGSGLRMRPRIRDKSGECFYGPELRVDWEGWKQISWDLVQTPPVDVQGGDGNRLQDCPPIEVVLEVFVQDTHEGDTLIMYADDLQVELAGPQVQK